MSELIDTSNLKPEDLLPQEKEWLKKFIKFSFSYNDKTKYVKRKNIIFTTQNGNPITYYVISPEFLKENNEQTIPGKFLREKYITKGIPSLKRDNEYFADICFIYWCFYYIDDCLDFLNILHEIFVTAFYSKYMEYDSVVKGYKILPEHLNRQFVSWSAIRKTFLIGFGVYIGLFQRETVPTLEEIFLGLENKTLELIGISKAHVGDFGMVSHNQKLRRCWNCGDEIDAPGGLCSDCYDYWDEKTK